MCVKLDVEEDQSYIRFFPVPRISCLEKERKKERGIGQKKEGRKFFDQKEYKPKKQKPRRNENTN